MFVPEHEKLAVYRHALVAVRLLEQVALATPETRVDLRDQLRRASASIALNVAEGASEYRAADKERFYRFARRSAGECLSILDVLREIAVAPIPANDARDELLTIMASLDKMIFALLRRK